MRAVLLELVRPLVDGFTEQLVDLLVADVQRRVGQLGEAFDVALSTFAAELAAHDVRDAGSGSLPGLAVPEVAVVAKQASTSLPASAARAARVDTSARPRAAVAQIRVGVAEPTSSARNSGDSRDRPAPSGRKVPTCRKCGARGFTSQGCGKTHNASTAPASAPSESSELRMGMSPASSPSIVSPPPNRSAFIAERAAQREAAKRERDERARSFIRRGDGSARGASGPVESSDVEEELRVATLPEALSSFDL